MPTLQRRRGPMHDINIVPYVDVMLVLLVIFMVTAPLVTPAVIDLPTLDKASQPRVVPIEIFVKADQGLRVRQRDASGQIVDERDVTKSELANVIKKARAKGGDPPVLIGGDKSARYESVLAVMDELWEAPSPPPAAPAVEAPKPPPQVEPEPPPVPKPDIAVKAPKPKPKPEPKPAPKKDVEFQKRLNEQLAQEQRTIDEQQREAERREAAARQQAIAAAARARALAAWVDKIRAKIRGNIRLPNDMSGNPETIFDVTQLPTGEVISIRLRKSSGHRGYDDAVERAILKSSPLPKPDQLNLFERQLELRFRPQDK